MQARHMNTRETTSALRRALWAGVLTLTLCTEAFSQTATAPADKPLSLSGPRFGVTFLSDSIITKLREENDIAVGSAVSQFGWQFEKQFRTTEDGPTLVTEWVVLVGGVEQSVFLPSVSWLLGMRTRSGVEFGVGPNLTPVGAALVIAAGRTFHVGGVNVPVNLAVVPSKVSWFSYTGPPHYAVEMKRKTGLRISLLFGFNTGS